MRRMQWDIFCRVIDNHGDLGVCWRLAAELATRGDRVRLHVDDASALAWMAPDRHGGVIVLPWPADDDMPALSDTSLDVVVEAFGCELPASVKRRLFATEPAPVWINLEYLSAEPFVEASHGLCSPQFGPPHLGPRAAIRRDKWFFFPGFTPRTGGVIRERGLMARRAAFESAAWLSSRGLVTRDGEQRVSLFCYANDALQAFVERLSDTPTLLLVAPGHAIRQVRHALGPSLRRGALRAVALPYLSQTDYDHLLWSCDLNFVRGEDSFVRAQWAGVPFVWQLYPQSDGAHVVKLEAFLQQFLADAEDGLAACIRGVFGAWNGVREAPPTWPDDQAWHRQAEAWRRTLEGQTELVTRLRGFASEKS
jgi:uncharacterized repeat protein (TIGR03837 family)